MGSQFIPVVCLVIKFCVNTIFFSLNTNGKIICAENFWKLILFGYQLSRDDIIWYNRRGGYTRILLLFSYKLIIKNYILNSKLK